MRTSYRQTSQNSSSSTSFDEWIFARCLRFRPVPRASYPYMLGSCYLTADLAKDGKSCALAYFHHPLFSSGVKYGSTPR
jgi:hypothetical protein